MGAFDYLFDDQVRAKDAQAITQAFRVGMGSAVKPLNKALEDAQAALSSGKESTAGEINAAQKAITEAVKGVSALVEGLSEQFTGLEAAILAEIRAIPRPEKVKIPKPKDVDLGPVLEAIQAIPRPEMPVFPEQKRNWTFDVVRNKTTGLIEKIEAR